MSKIVVETYLKAFKGLKKKIGRECATINDFVAICNKYGGINLYLEGMYPYFDIVNEGFVFSIIYNRIDNILDIAEINMNQAIVTNSEIVSQIHTHKIAV